jgi:putative lipoic acid-binding regulatory protein
MKEKPILPGPYPIKIVTYNNAETTEAILGIIQSHFPSYDHKKTKQNHSKGSQYVSTTVIVHAETETQLESLHQDLKAVAGVIMVL